MLNVVPLPNVPTLNLSTHGYDIVIMDAPVATGTLLHVLAWVLTQPAIGPLLTRFLLNNNKVWHIRELAAQVPQTVVFKPLPAYSVDAETMKRHQAAARQEQTAVDDATDEKAIRIGMPSVYAPIRGGRPRYWGAAHYREAYETKATTPTSVADALLVGRARLEAQLGTIFTEIHPDLVREQAAASTRRWAAGQPLSALDGVPIAVKEMVDIAGHRTAAGARRGGPGDDARLPIARTDDPIVARFRGVGALIIGQAAMTEYGVTPLGWSMHAQGPSNPFNASHYSGGSSSGSAVAVAAGLVPIAIGFDGGGSIRIPAALSGVVGLACGYGRVPFACDAASSMTHAGPLSSRVHDAALAYWLMARPPPLNAPNDPKHTTTHGVHADGAPPAHLGGLLHHGGGSQHRLSSCADLAGIRIGVFTAHADDATAEVRGAAREARAALTRLGATLVEIELPQLMSLSVAHGMLISSEFASDHDREYTDGAPRALDPHPAGPGAGDDGGRVRRGEQAALVGHGACRGPLPCSEARCHRRAHRWPHRAPPHARRARDRRVQHGSDHVAHPAHLPRQPARSAGHLRTHRPWPGYALADRLPVPRSCVGGRRPSFYTWPACCLCARRKGPSRTAASATSRSGRLTFSMSSTACWRAAHDMSVAR